MKEFMRFKPLNDEQVVFLRESKLGKHFLGDQKIESRMISGNLSSITTYDVMFPS
jgi:hypothetical protein